MAELDRAGRSDLHYAALEGRTADVTRLLESGADPALADRQGWTPLHFAAQSLHADIGRALIAAGAPVDAADRTGRTPLLVAMFNVRDGDGSIIRVLLDGGADPHHRNQAGISAYDHADTVANYDLGRHLPPHR